MDRINTLFEKYKNNQCSPQEIEELLEYFSIGHDEDLLKTHIGAALNQAIENSEELEQDTHDVYLQLQAHIRQKGRVRVMRMRRIAVAASVILCLSIGSYFLFHRQPTLQTAQNQVHDIAPGSNKAILKLANGKTIVITGARNGLMVQQVNTTINKTADGQLTYNNTANNTETAMQYDTLIVPRGGQHQVKFADGSIAYLNADTKLRIPENFRGSDRTVELISGEADFHVVHNAKMPFMVNVKGQITKDIGTEFNINAYPDERVIKTTLLEGSVSVSKTKRSATLKPGQQAVIQSSSNEIEVGDADTDEAFAWKNGKFIFSSTPLGNIMRQVSRWYDVDVVYQDDAMKVKPFSAISTRFTNVSQVLHDLELTGEVKFKIQGKTITVLKK